MWGCGGRKVSKAKKIVVLFVSGFALAALAGCLKLMVANHEPTLSRVELDAASAELLALLETEGAPSALAAMQMVALRKATVCDSCAITLEQYEQDGERSRALAWTVWSADGEWAYTFVPLRRVERDAVVTYKPVGRLYVADLQSGHRLRIEPDGARFYDKRASGWGRGMSPDYARELIAEAVELARAS